MSEHDKALLQQIEAILSGIDKTETSRDDGWWATSVGAAFGARKLEEIRALFAKAGRKRG